MSPVRLIQTQSTSSQSEPELGVTRKATSAPRRSSNSEEMSVVDDSFLVFEADQTATPFVTTAQVECAVPEGRLYL